MMGLYKSVREHSPISPTASFRLTPDSFSDTISEDPIFEVGDIRCVFYGENGYGMIPMEKPSNIPELPTGTVLSSIGFFDGKNSVALAKGRDKDYLLKENDTWRSID